MSHQTALEDSGTARYTALHGLAAMLLGNCLVALMVAMPSGILALEQLEFNAPDWLHGVLVSLLPFYAHQSPA